MAIGASDPSLTGGGRYGMVPADVLADRRLSRPARWLFAVLCAHANKQGLCRLRLEAIARAEQVTVRAVQGWLRKLEEAGRVVRYPEAGRADVYRVVRDPAKVAAAREDNAPKLKERKRAFTPPKRPAAVDKPEGAARRGAGASQNPGRSPGRTGEAEFTTLVKPGSPPGAAVVNPRSPPSEQRLTKGFQQLSRGRPKRRGGRGKARQGDPGGRHQGALLMPIAGGRSGGRGGDGGQASRGDPGLELILNLLLSAVERLLALNREGRLTEGEIRRTIDQVTGGGAAGTASGDPG